MKRIVLFTSSAYFISIYTISISKRHVRTSPANTWTLLGKGFDDDKTLNLLTRESSVGGW